MTSISQTIIQNNSNSLFSPGSELVIRYYFEVLALISICGIFYASLNAAAVHGIPSLQEMGHILTQFPYHFALAGSVIFIGIPLILRAIPHKDQKDWTASYIPCTARIIGVAMRAMIGFVIDILILPFAGMLVLMAAMGKSNFDPNAEETKKDRMPILLIHGNDFNETEWVVGRQFLKKQQYGSVYSLNYDGLIIHDQKKGPDDYAAQEISQKIDSILQETGQQEIILICHSMGGLIAAHYAEKIAPQKVKHIISVATPWQGAPLLKYTKCLPPLSSKRYHQMTPGSAYLQDIQVLAEQSLSSGKRHYYNIYSTTDFFVPNNCGLLSRRIRDDRKHSFSFLGHYGLIAWPGTWIQIRQWLDEIYCLHSTTEGQ